MNVFMIERRLDVKTFSRFLEQLEEDSEHMTDSWSRGVNPYFEHELNTINISSWKSKVFRNFVCFSV